MQTLKEDVIKPGQRVLVRAPLDVLAADGKIKDFFRLNAALPTLKYITAHGAKPIIMGHIEPTTLSTSHLKPFFDQNLGPTSYELLENLRADPREIANDDGFAKELATKGDIYVNESFETCHRKHTSIVGIPKYLPAYAGFQLVCEIEMLTKIMQKPEQPLITLIGGIKIESKLSVVQKFALLSSHVLLGAGLSKEYEKLDATTRAKYSNILSPFDYAEHDYDIGGQTIEKYVGLIATAKSVLWSGPTGWFENPLYEEGTRRIVQAICDVTKNGALSVVGGGDTVAAITKFGILDKFTFVSTGGGAMLEFLANGTLPGTTALNQ